MFRGQICNLGKTAINFRDSKEATPMQLNHLSSILVLPPANSAYLWFFKLPSGEFHHLKSSEIYTDFTLFPQLAPKTCNPHDKKIHINEVTPVYQLTNLHKFNDHFKSNTSCIQSTPYDSEVTSQNRRVAVPASCLFVGHPHAWGHHCHKHYAPADSAKTKMKLNVCQSLGSNQV